MLEEVAIAVSTGAAGNVVAYALNGQIDALRTQVTRIFRHGTEQERARALQAVERDVVALGELSVSRADVADQWRDLLLSYLKTHPEARKDMESFATSPTASKTVHIGSQNFYGPGSFGGNNNGTINNFG